MMKHLWPAILREPYRLFFPLGILMGFSGIGHWLYYGLGWTTGYSGFFHSSLQMQAYMLSFVIGFLTTSMPRFASAPHATTYEILRFLLSISGVWVFSFFGYWALSELSFIAALVSLALFARRRFMRRQALAMPPVEFVWIPIALLHGIAGAALLALTQMRLIAPWWAGLGKPLVDQGLLLAIVLGVGGFLIPRLMGRFQATQPAQVLAPSELLLARRRKFHVHLAGGLALFLSFFVEGLVGRTPGMLLRAGVVTGIILWNRVWPGLPKAPDLYLKLLWCSMGMVVAGHWAAVIFPRYRVEMLHWVFIGGYALMTFAIGTMVSLSHAGEAALLRRPLWILRLVASGIALSVALRTSAPFFPALYFKIIAAASVAWMVIAACWSLFIFRRLLKVTSPDEFERFHKQAKQRLKTIQDKMER